LTAHVGTPSAAHGLPRGLLLTQATLLFGRLLSHWDWAYQSLKAMPTKPSAAGSVPSTLGVVRPGSQYCTAARGSALIAEFTRGLGLSAMYSAKAITTAPL